MELTWLKRLARILTLAIALVFILTIACPVLSQSYEDKEEKDEMEQIIPGQVAPDFTAIDMDGNEFSLLSTASEIPIVLDFWATWCPPCRAEFPLLNDFQKAHEGEVMVVAVSSEEAESEEAILDFLEENDIVFRIIHDPSRTYMDQYFVTAIPFVVVIDNSGTVVKTHLGYSPEIREELEEDLGLEPAEYPPIEEEEDEEEDENEDED